MVSKFSFLFMVLCLCVSGCGDERLPSPMVFFGEGEAANVEIPPDQTIGPVPEDVAIALWGDRDDLMRQLLALQEDAHGKATRLISEICTIDDQVAYYTKYINAGGIAIVGERLVNDKQFFATQEAVLEMTAKRPEIRDKLSWSTGFRMILLVGGSRWAFKLPEEDSVTGHVYPLGWCASKYCVAHVSMEGEEIRAMGVFVHEFAHAMHRAIKTLDPTFDARLKAAYAEALESGSYWRDDISELRNYREYWAGSVEEWLMDLTHPDPAFDDLRVRFMEKDPLLYELLQEWIPFTYLAPLQWKF